MPAAIPFITAIAAVGSTAVAVKGASDAKKDRKAANDQANAAVAQNEKALAEAEAEQKKQDLNASREVANAAIKNKARQGQRGARSGTLLTNPAAIGNYGTQPKTLLGG